MMQTERSDHGLNRPWSLLSANEGPASRRVPLRRESPLDCGGRWSLGRLPEIVRGVGSGIGMQGRSRRAELESRTEPRSLSYTRRTSPGPSSRLDFADSAVHRTSEPHPGSAEAGWLCWTCLLSDSALDRRPRIATAGGNQLTSSTLELPRQRHERGGASELPRFQCRRSASRPGPGALGVVAGGSCLPVARQNFTLSLRATSLSVFKAITHRLRILHHDPSTVSPWTARAH